MENERKSLAQKIVQIGGDPYQTAWAYYAVYGEFDIQKIAGTTIPYKKSVDPEEPHSEVKENEENQKFKM